MPASYPGAIKTFTTKTNKVDLVDAAHVNDLQLEVNAIETELGVDVAGTATDLVTRLTVSLAASGAIAQGTAEPTSPTPVIGQPFYRTDTDQFKIYDGASWDVIGPGALTIKSVTTLSAVNNSGDIAIEASKIYKVVISLTDVSADDTIALRFNSDATGSYLNNIDSAITYLTIGQVDFASANNRGFSCAFDLDTNVVNNNRARVHGTANYYTTASVFTVRDIGGNYIAATTLLNFEVLSVGGATLTGKVYVYEFGLSL